MKTYKARIADSILKRKLEGKGAILIEGPKWCGKTTTAQQVSNSVLYMDDPEKKAQNLSMAELNPKRLLEGETPRLIDEWQLAPKLWDAIRHEVDRREGLGHFILTGSAVPVETKDISHSGTGRFSWILMRTMSLYESGESNGTVSLADIFNGNTNIDGYSTLGMDDIAYLTCRGGWPGSLGMRPEIALEQPFDYYNGVVNSDINRADGISKNPERVKRLMRSFARNIGTQVAGSVLMADMNGNSDISISENTVSLYLTALKRIFVIEDMPAWNPNLRSKTAIRTSDTRYFTDPSVAAASLGIGPDDLIEDLNTFGFMFENLCIRDLRVYADALGGGVYHYRDKSGLECDAVIHIRNGRYGLIEIKLGGEKLIEDGARNLLKLRDKIDTDKMKEPSFMMILTAIGDYAYRRKDGILIVPIGCLKD